jgi:pentapeptide MXKDX repeat protein
LLRCTLAESFDGKKTKHILAGVYSEAEGRFESASQKFFRPRVTNPIAGAVLNIAASVAFETVSKGRPTMTIRTRIALGVTAAAVSLSLALAPAAFAQDKMGKDDAMKKDSMSKDSMKKDDGMKKDSMAKDSMKKDDGMKKDEMKK